MPTKKKIKTSKKTKAVSRSKVKKTSSQSSKKRVKTRKAPSLQLHSKEAASSFVTARTNPPSSVDLIGSQPSELPFSYNVTKLVLMARDPYWVFSYWDFSGETWNWIQELYRSNPNSMRAILRAYDVTDIKFNGLNANHFFDIEVPLESKNWYTNLNESDREWIFDLALVDANNKFYLIARSNRVKTPRDRPSDEIDEDWMIANFDEIYALSGGFGSGLDSAELRKLVNSRYLTERTVSSSFSKKKNSYDPHP